MNKPVIGTIFETVPISWTNDDGTTHTTTPRRWQVVEDESGTPDDPEIFIIQCVDVPEVITAFDVKEFWDRIDGGQFKIIEQENNGNI